MYFSSYGTRIDPGNEIFAPETCRALNDLCLDVAEVIIVRSN